MAAQTFGVVLATVQAEFGDLDLSAWSARVTEWISQSAALWCSYLRREGFEPDEVAGYGSGDDLYQLGATFITHHAAARAAVSSSLQKPDLADWHTAEAEKIKDVLHGMPEATTEEWDPSEQQGSFRTNRRLRWPSSETDRPRTRTRFRRGMCS